MDWKGSKSSQRSYRDMNKIQAEELINLIKQYNKLADDDPKKEKLMDLIVETIEEQKLTYKHYE